MALYAKILLKTVTAVGIAMKIINSAMKHRAHITLEKFHIANRQDFLVYKSVVD